MVTWVTWPSEPQVMIEFRGAMGDLLKANSCLTKVPIQSTILWQGRSVLLDGGSGGPNNKPSGEHHGRPPSGPLNGHPSKPLNGPLSEHFREPSIGLASRHFGKSLGGPLDKLYTNLVNELISLIIAIIQF